MSTIYVDGGKFSRAGWNLIFTTCACSGSPSREGSFSRAHIILHIHPLTFFQTLCQVSHAPIPRVLQVMEPQNTPAGTVPDDLRVSRLKFNGVALFKSDRQFRIDCGRTHDLLMDFSPLSRQATIMPRITVYAEQFYLLYSDQQA